MFKPVIFVPSLLPMNFESDDILKSSLLRDRQKIGSSLADVDPMTIDRTVSMCHLLLSALYCAKLRKLLIFWITFENSFLSCVIHRKKCRFCT